MEDVMEPAVSDQPAGSLKSRYKAVMERVAAAAERTERPADAVRVVAVTKYAEPEQIREIVALGCRDLGENKVQQLVQRAAMLGEHLERRRSLAGVGARAGEHDPARPEDIRWHMIGGLQRNKVKKCIEASRLIHSVDSLRLAEELQMAAAKLDQDEPIEVLLQINCSNEPQKGGVLQPAAVHVAEQIDSMVQLRLRGVMTMAADGVDETELRATFERCRDCMEDIQKEGFGDGHCDILSMGMSNDYEIAIEEGSNLVRIGGAIFGPRPASAEDDD